MYFLFVLSREIIISETITGRDMHQLWLELMKTHFWFECFRRRDAVTYC